MSSKRPFCFLLFAVLCHLFLLTSCLQQTTPPNILLIISDDQRYDTMPHMTQTVEQIFEQGITFERAYVTTSRCCPSRASILTGQYVHNHGVFVNSDPLEKPTFVEALHNGGYTTGLVGKYLNSYPTSPDDPPRPEFDRWVGMISGPNNARYFDTSLNVDGVWTEHSGYQTEILAAYAIEFLQQAVEEERPFFLQFSPYTPHLPALPAPGDEQLFLDLPPHNPPNFNPNDMSGKPEWMQQLPPLTDDQIVSIQADRLRQIQSQVAFDEAIARLLQELEGLGVMENTAVIYLSDNGLFQGEHRLPIGKIYAYEESTHIPFAIRFDSLIRTPRIENRMVANIDIAPTILELAGVEHLLPMDGLSLLPLLGGQHNPEWRSHLLLEGFPIGVAYVGNSPNFQAVHNGRYVYIETDGQMAELYDLETDPHQLNNHINNKDYTQVIAQMQAALAEERERMADGR